MSPEALRPRRSVVVITVSYRSAELVKASLRALAAERELEREQGLDVSAVIVDNASGDAPAIASAIESERWSGWATLITAERNGGFAYGNNVALRHVYESGARPDFFFFLNPDAEVRPNSIGELIRFLDAHPQAGSAGPCLEGGDGEAWPYAYRFPSWVSEVNNALALGLFTKLAQRRVVQQRMGDEPTEVDWYPGAAMMVPRRVIDQLGGMDESYFLYYEETDFCLKLQRAGYSNWYVPSSRVMHLAGKSTGLSEATMHTRRMPKHWFESRRRYYAKNLGMRYAMAADAAYLMAHVAGELKCMLQRKPHGRPYLTRDFVANSVLLPQNRALEPTREFHPAAQARPAAGPAIASAPEPTAAGQRR